MLLDASANIILYRMLLDVSAEIILYRMLLDASAEIILCRMLLDASASPKTTGYNKHLNLIRLTPTQHTL